jgi:pyruvate ferredoxin oxidoreductase alpha subunit
MNASAQFRGVLQKELGRFGDKLYSLLKYNGNPFEPADVVDGFEARIGGSTDTSTIHTRIDPAAGDR